MNKNNENKRSKYNTFLNDGFSERDFLMVSSAGVFFLFVTIGLIMILLGKEIEPTYLTLLNIVSDVVMAIVISLFGVDGVTEITGYLKQKSNNEAEQSDSIEVTVKNEEEDDII